MLKIPRWKKYGLFSFVLGGGMLFVMTYLSAVGAIEIAQNAVSLVFFLFLAWPFLIPAVVVSVDSGIAFWPFFIMLGILLNLLWLFSIGAIIGWAASPKKEMSPSL